MRYKNLPHTTDVLLRRLHIFFGKRNVLNARWWGVALGQNIKFSGKCYFWRYPGSIIRVGNNCQFLSRANANFAGINHPCSITTFSQEAIIEIGDNCGFSGIAIGCVKSVRLGRNVRCGPNTIITDSDEHLDDPRAGKPKEIVIGDNVWLGMNVVVLKGVTIGENSLIGANSVVTKSIPANVVAAGTPCKVIKNVI